MKPRRILSCMMALLLAATMPLTAFAGTYDVAEGSVTVNASESGQTVTHGTNDAVNDSAPVITQSTETTANTVTIHADAWATANVTLSGVNIDTSGTDQAAVEVTGNGDVVIELDGNNTVKSGEKHAGVEKNTVAPTDTVPGSGNGKLTITDEKGADGSLKANGGEGGAGIGGGANGSASNITISGGEVTAAGGNVLKIEHGDAVEILAGAGIGGGGGGNGSNITISGGTVTATGGENAAGIGGGTGGNGNNITISGSTTTAIGGDPQKIVNDDGNVVEEAPGGGAGIGGGAYGEGNNIAVKYTAQVTATGKGNAANIGNGYDNKYEGKQQPDNVDLSGLSSFGKVNGVSGSDGGYHASNGSINSVPSIPSIVGHKATGIGGLKVSDNNGNGLANEYLLAEDALNITAPADNVLVTGNKADLLQLKEEGVKKINLQTNRVNVSVSNQVLEKITGSGESFQLTADDTTVSISSTAGNNQKNPGLKLTADKLPEKGKLQADFCSEESKEGAGDVRESLTKTLQVSTNAPEATLTCDQQYLQTLMDSELRNLVLKVGKVLAAVDSLLAANTTVNGSGSISIGNNTVNMNGIEFSAGDSSENDKLTDLLNNIKFKTENQLKTENQPQGSSAMVVEVNPKASLQSASLKVPGSALQSLIDQGVEATALSANGKTTSFKNSNLLKQIQDSQLGSTATVTDKPFANDEAKIWPETVVKDGNVIIPADELL
ncbi:MAG: hypothetical protein J6B70_06630 [Oscillospiraceae bacterium]|nr:hypothetical protein [Oscillospiraceae bacterium]